MEIKTLQRSRLTVDSIIIFIHGVNSGPDTCWGDASINWPKLVIGDPRLDRFDINVAKYFTGFNSGDYGLADCATALLKSINSKSAEGAQRSALGYHNVIFVAHSFGGVVVRYMLDAHRQHFSKKRIGLILMASPSGGSMLSDVVRFFTWLIPHKQRDELSSRSPLLEDLDKRFKRMVHDKSLPFELKGIEAYEQRGMGGFLKIVSKESAAKYFGETISIPGSDHSSIVKPKNIEHDSHRLLVEFCEDYGRNYYPEMAQLPANVQTHPSEDKALFEIYTQDCEPHYLVRPDDLRAESILKFSCMWLFGKSGVGKTSLARRALTLNGQSYIYVYLANCERPVSSNLLGELMYAIRNEDDHVHSERTERLRLVDVVATAAKSGGNDIALFLDEMPVSKDDEAEVSKVCGLLADLIFEIKVAHPDVRIRMVVASIHEPTVHQLMPDGKFSESFRVTEVSDWGDSDLTKLKGKILSAPIFSTSKDKIESRIESLGRTPRELKSKIRTVVSELEVTQ